ncbi:hypothetical protein [Marinihelvus fidelis]|nr:hypothetical protein [Marinihelvus fidelis]
MKLDPITPPEVNAPVSQSAAVQKRLTPFCRPQPAPERGRVSFLTPNFRMIVFPKLGVLVAGQPGEIPFVLREGQIPVLVTPGFSLVGETFQGNQL